MWGLKLIKSDISVGIDGQGYKNFYYNYGRFLNWVALKKISITIDS